MKGYVIAGSLLSLGLGAFMAYQGDPSRTEFARQMRAVFGDSRSAPAVIYGSPSGPAPAASRTSSSHDAGGDWREPPRTLQAAEMRCAVTYLTDGDTFSAGCTPGGDVRVRVRGVDTPERGEARYNEARAALDAMLRRCGFRVTVIPHHRSYDRIVGDVLCGGVNIGQAMDAAGWSRSVGARR